MPALLGTRRVPYLGGAWTPARLPGLVLWLDARSIGQADNTSVARWPDRSGKGNDATQGTAAQQPTYLAAGLNGRPAVRFDGVDDNLDAPDTPSLDVAAVSLFVVARPDVVSGSSSAEIVVKAQAATWVAPFASYALRLRLGAPNGFVSGNTDALSGAGAVAGTPYLLGYCHGSGATVLSVNGGTTRGVAANAIVGAAFPLVLGSATGAVELFTGPVAHVLIYNRALADGERHAVEGYLSARYGIPVVQQ